MKEDLGSAKRDGSKVTASPFKLAILLENDSFISNMWKSTGEKGFESGSSNESPAKQGKEEGCFGFGTFRRGRK